MISPVPALYARCSACGTRRPVTEIVIEGAVDSIAYGNVVSCHNCGGNAEVEPCITDHRGDLYLVAEELLEHFERGNFSAGKLRELRDWFASHRSSESIESLPVELRPVERKLRRFGLEVSRCVLSVLLSFFLNKYLQQEAQNREHRHREELIRQSLEASAQREKIIEILTEILKSRSTKSDVIEDLPPRILKGRDRNKPCPCGSGRKAKRCHGVEL